MVNEGQLLYVLSKAENGKIHYDIGMVTEVYDQRFLLKNKYSREIVACLHSELKENLQSNEEGMQVLTKDGKPVFAKKNIFGKYKI